MRLLLSFTIEVLSRVAGTIESAPCGALGGFVFGFEVFANASSRRADFPVCSTFK